MSIKSKEILVSYALFVDKNNLIIKYVELYKYILENEKRMWYNNSIVPIFKKTIVILRIDLL